MTEALAFEVKQAAAMAFSRHCKMSTYDVLNDARLCPSLTALWDCATLAELNTCVEGRMTGPTMDGGQEQLASRAYLITVLMTLPLTAEAAL